MLNVEPPIWRRVLVDGQRSLDDLHLYFQIVMGWANSHLHEFRIGNARYGMRHPAFDDLGDGAQDESKFTLEQVAPFVGVEFIYLYDFGDSWELLVKVEAIEEPEEKAFKTVCLAGERSGPPEDVGGITGYEEFLEAMADSDHPEHATMVDWIGGEFNPEYFPLEVVNNYLAELDFDASYDSIVAPTYTYRQGQYLAFIYYYTKVNRIPPAQATCSAISALRPHPYTT